MLSRRRVSIFSIFPLYLCITLYRGNAVLERLRDISPDLTLCHAYLRFRLANKMIVRMIFKNRGKRRDRT